jgi:hypothetical protein
MDPRRQNLGIEGPRSAKELSSTLTHGFHGTGASHDAGSSYHQDVMAKRSEKKMAQKLEKLITHEPKQPKPEPLSKKEKQRLHMMSFQKK